MRQSILAHDDSDRGMKVLGRRRWGRGLEDTARDKDKMDRAFLARLLASRGEVAE